MIVSVSVCVIAQSTDLALMQGGREALSFRKSGTGYAARSASASVDIVREQSGYKFNMAGAAYRVKQKDASWKILTPQGQLLFKIKLKGDKIKVLRSEEDANPWEIKLKGDHYKIVRSGAEYGKVAFDRSKNKLTVKDRTGGKIAVASSGGLTAAPAAVLITGLTEQERLLLFALLCLVGR